MDKNRGNKKGTVRTDSALEDGGMVAAHHMVAVAGLDVVAACEEVAVAREQLALGSEAATHPGGHPG
ncbi:hypothetical protein [Leifsonia shinshuensis]|uniref:Uncharacterized protein n=1 Tax=Leifsonia shinshuensis TaxID=150026 RepID=A0A7G6YFP2_9MICO|nr:hypothetical protein [Leifsonia shinshuensis]QNE37307.1 hypothetical protein F1C12_20765 [Leifsonia shinshuensis]